MDRIKHIKSLKIVLHNVNTWTRDRRNELSNYYNRIEADIILLNSISLLNDERVKIYNYNVYQKNKENERQAGVAIAIRKNIEHQLWDDFDDDLLAVKVKTRRGPIIVSTLYSPPRRNYLPVGDLGRLLHRNLPVYLFGDLNAQHHTFGYNYANTKGRILVDMINRGQISHMGPDFNTLINRNGRPDILLVNRHNIMNTAVIQGDITTADHIPIVVKLSTNPIIVEDKRIKDYRNANWELFREKLEQKVTRQQEEITLNDGRVDRRRIDEALEKWTDDLVRTEAEIVPNKTITRQIRPPTSDLLRLLETSYDTIRERSIQTIEQRQQTRQIQSMIMEELKRLSNERWSSEINKMQDVYNDPRKFWDKVRRLMGGSKDVPPYISDERGNKYYSDDEKEGQFRHIWTDIFRITDEEEANFDRANDRRVNEFINDNEPSITPYEYADLERLNAENYMTRPTTRREIKQIIKDLKNNKAPGLSGINKVILLNIPDIAIDRFVEILNLTMSMGYFPVLYKNGIIVLVVKPGKNGRDPTDYRPITLLEIPGKLLERVLNSRLQKFCERNNIYHYDQYGFRAGLGTELAIAKIYETVALNQKEKQHCNIICRDVSKAFDKIWHRGLKYKLCNINLPPITTRILSSYLDNRTAQIRIGSTLGPKINIQSGVPQGGILSPTLFILYTSDLPRAGPNSLDTLFADDITQVIQHPGIGRQMLARRTEREVERVNDYEAKWKINTNIRKFGLLSVSKTRPDPVHIDGRRIQVNNEIKILGLKLKRTGTVQHIGERLNMAKTQTNKLKRFMNLSSKTKTHLYKALVRPLMEYPVIPLALASKTQKMKMQRLQNKNLRIIAKNDPALEEQTIEQLHQSLNIEAVNIRLRSRLIKLWNKVELKEPELYQTSMNANRNPSRDHTWWPRAGQAFEEDDPNPIYT